MSVSCLSFKRCSWVRAGSNFGHHMTSACTNVTQFHVCQPIKRWGFFRPRTTKAAEMKPQAAAFKMNGNYTFISTTSRCASVPSDFNLKSPSTDLKVNFSIGRWWTKAHQCSKITNPITSITSLNSLFRDLNANASDSNLQRSNFSSQSSNGSQSSNVEVQRSNFSSQSSNGGQSSNVEIQKSNFSSQSSNGGQSSEIEVQRSNFSSHSSNGGQSSEVEFKVPWGKVRGLAWGDSSNHTLICIPGSSHNAASFRRLAPFLLDDWHVVAIDLPGHGHSDHLPGYGPYSNAVFLTALLCVVLEEGKTASLLGHCFGAIVAYQFASLYPEMVRSLISLDSTCYVHHEAVAEVLAGRSNPASVGVKPSYLNELKSYKGDPPTAAVVFRTYLTDYVKRARADDPAREPEKLGKDEIIRRMMAGAFEILPREAAELLFERSHRLVGDDSYLPCNDPWAGVMVFDNGFLGDEHNMINCLKECRWKLLIVRSTEGTNYNHFKYVLRMFEQHLPSGVVFKTVPGGHQNHMTEPQHAAKHILTFLETLD